jgi:hypothetical protein
MTRAAPALGLVVALAGATACAGARGGAMEAAAEPVCHEGVVQVTGSDPFTELAVIAADGTRLEIDRDATEIAALTGATVRLCVTADPVTVSTDIAAFDLVGVEEVDAVLGTVDGDQLRRAATGEVLRLRANAAALADVADGCVWIAGPVEDGVISLWSWGSAPASICELAGGRAE